MKTSIATFLFCLFGLFAVAETPLLVEGLDDCREIAVYDNLNLTASVKVALDLSSGTWTRDHQVGQNAGIYKFHDSGILEIIRPDESGAPKYESYLWRVEEYNNQPFLVLTTNDFQRELLYQTLPTCQGMVLIDPVSIDQLSLKYHTAKEYTPDLTIGKRLEGVWQSATYPFEMADSYDDCGAFEPIDGAYLEYDFNADGTFVKRYGSSVMDFEDHGLYEIVGDGQYVLFHIEDEAGNYHQHVARIRYLEYGEMVLEQVLESDDFADFFCSQLKSITFVQ